MYLTEPKTPGFVTHKDKYYSTTDGVELSFDAPKLMKVDESTTVTTGEFWPEGARITGTLPDILATIYYMDGNEKKFARAVLARDKTWNIESDALKFDPIVYKLLGRDIHKMGLGKGFKVNYTILTEHL
jgi:hypothetical protein